MSPTKNWLYPLTKGHLVKELEKLGTDGGSRSFSLLEASRKEMPHAHSYVPRGQGPDFSGDAIWTGSRIFLPHPFDDPFELLLGDL